MVSGPLWAVVILLVGLPILVVGTFMSTAEPGPGGGAGAENDSFRTTFDWLYPLVGIWFASFALALGWSLRRWATRADVRLSPVPDPNEVECRVGADRDLATLHLRWWESRRVDQRALFVFLWCLAFLVIHFVALLMVIAVHPAGLDECEAAASSGTRDLMGVIGTAAVVGTAALALWWLRGRLRLAALFPLAISGYLWWLLLWGGSQNCAPGL